MREINSNILIKKHAEEHYFTAFNTKTGLFIRCEYDGYDEPFWAVSGPELLDISITNWCDKGCRFCYRNSSVNGKMMSIIDYEKIIQQACNVGVLQIAIGGGNPNQHPDFIEIIRLTREKYGIVPSFTTNGRGLTKEVINAAKQYCGAVAVSAYYPFDELRNAVGVLTNNDIKTNIHFLLSSESVVEGIELLSNIPDYLSKINAIIFLSYKPVGNESTEKLILNNSDRFAELFQLIAEKKYPFKIGFDSCSISGITKYMNINKRYLEACEAGRFSAFISEEMRMYPCSFMVNTCEGVDLRKYSLKEVWTDSVLFNKMRDRIKNNNCIDKCHLESICKGGCTIFDNINLCNIAVKVQTQNI